MQHTKEIIASIKQKLTERKVPEMLTASMSLSAIALGLAMIIYPDAYANNGDYNEPLKWASAQAWGVLYVLSGVTVGATAAVDRRLASIPLVALIAVHTIIGGLTIISNVNGSGAVPSTIILYLTLSTTCLITIIACLERGHND